MPNTVTLLLYPHFHLCDLPGFCDLPWLLRGTMLSLSMYHQLLPRGGGGGGLRIYASYYVFKSSLVSSRDINSIALSSLTYTWTKGQKGRPKKFGFEFLRTQLFVVGVCTMYHMKEVLVICFA